MKSKKNNIAPEGGKVVKQEGGAPGTARASVFIPYETLGLYKSMAESIRTLTELLKMQGWTSPLGSDEKRHRPS